MARKRDEESRLEEHLAIIRDKLLQLSIRKAEDDEKSRIAKSLISEEKRSETKALRRAEENLIQSYFNIRTRKKFNSRNPLAFSCPYGSICQDEQVRNSAEMLMKHKNMSLLDFILQLDAFICLVSSTRLLFKGRKRIEFMISLNAALVGGVGIVPRLGKINWM